MAAMAVRTHIPEQQGDNRTAVVDREAYAVDAGDGPVHGSDKADYRLHYAIGLFDLGMKEMVLTGTEQGEKAGNFKSFGEGDIVTGDRGYCGKQGIEYLLGRGERFFIPVWDEEVSCVQPARRGSEGVGVF
jgi:hypothetical protein